MKKYSRCLFYFLGIIILSLGLVINTKTGLGVAPLLSVAFCTSTIFNVSLGSMIFLAYTICVLGQWILFKKNFKLINWLQIIISLVISSLVDFFSSIINIVVESLFSSIVLLVFAIVFTGIGTALSVAMNFIPIAPDGLAHAIGDKANKGFGLGKNIFDFTCVAITIIINLIFKTPMLGIGVGTIIEMITVGRIISFANKSFIPKLLYYVN